MTERAIESSPTHENPRLVTLLPGVVTIHDIAITTDYDGDVLKPGVLTNPAIGKSEHTEDNFPDKTIWEG